MANAPPVTKAPITTINRTRGVPPEVLGSPTAQAGDLLHVCTTAERPRGGRLAGQQCPTALAYAGALRRLHVECDPLSEQAVAVAGWRRSNDRLL